MFCWDSVGFRSGGTACGAGFVEKPALHEVPTVATRLREFALETLSPTRCASCESPGALVCDDCLEKMVRIDPALSCVRCGAPFGSLLCTECRDRDLSIDRCLAATVFDGPPSRIVRAYKDAGERRLASVVAEIMFEALVRADSLDPPRFQGVLSECDAICFVPATAGAFRRRGFDHMECVARELSALSGLPVLDALAKHDRRDQRLLGRTGRREQARGAYEVVADVEGLRALLIDDVATTCATLDASARELKRAHAARVDALAFARVWD